MSIGPELYKGRAVMLTYAVWNRGLEVIAMARGNGTGDEASKLAYLHSNFSAFSEESQNVPMPAPTVLTHVLT